MKNVTEFTEASEGSAGQIQHSLLDNLVDKIGELIDQEREVINLSFPLSGGDDTHIFKAKETSEKSSTWTSFLHVLETEFPLSGGEAGW